MSSNHFVFNGLEELRAELRTLPAMLRDEASSIIYTAGNEAADTIKTAYARHRITGDLEDHVVVNALNTGAFGAGVVVKSTSRLAFIFEHGTQARHYISVRNKQHLTGAMPAVNIFVPTIMRARRSMYDRLADLLVRHGLRARTDAAA